MLVRKFIYIVNSIENRFITKPNQNSSFNGATKSESKRNS